MIAVFVGSNLQSNTRVANSHAYLSDVGAAIEVTEKRFIPARATSGIICRILEASEPGPNSKARLEELNTELHELYPEPVCTPVATALDYAFFLRAFFFGFAGSSAGASMASADMRVWPCNHSVAR